MSKSSKGQPSRKRPAKQPEDFFWDCSVCTYKNNPEAFKCVMCDVRKGTSTRKSRINPDLVAVQVQHALLPPPLPPKLLAGMSREAEEAEEEQEEQEDQDEVNDSHEMPPPASPAEEQPSPSTSSASTPSNAKGPQKKTPAKPKSAKPTSNRSKFKNVDRKNAVSTEITVDNVTVMITEYKLKVKKEKKDSHSSGSSVVGEPPSTINDDSLERPGPSSKTGSGAESEPEGVRPNGQARGGSEDMETTRSS